MLSALTVNKQYFDFTNENATLNCYIPIGYCLVCKQEFSHDAFCNVNVPSIISLVKLWKIRYPTINQTMATEDQNSTDLPYILRLIS